MVTRMNLEIILCVRRSRFKFYDKWSHAARYYYNSSLHAGETPHFLLSTDFIYFFYNIFSSKYDQHFKLCESLDQD